MNQDVKAKWVAALRSGQYQQAFRQLKSDTGYCCLGVLCEVSSIETGFGLLENKMEAGGEVIGKTIQYWAGLEFMSGAAVDIEGSHNLLTNHNDNEKTFEQIANAIEHQL